MNCKLETECGYISHALNMITGRQEGETFREIFVSGKSMDVLNGVIDVNTTNELLAASCYHWHYSSNNSYQTAFGISFVGAVYLIYRYHVEIWFINANIRRANEQNRIRNADFAIANERKFDMKNSIWYLHQHHDRSHDRCSQWKSDRMLWNSFPGLLWVWICVLCCAVCIVVVFVGCCCCCFVISNEMHLTIRVFW